MIQYYNLSNKKSWKKKPPANAESVILVASERYKKLKYDIFSQFAEIRNTRMVKSVLLSFIIVFTIIILTSSFVEAKRRNFSIGKCGLSVSTLGQVCHICKNIAKQDTHIQNRSIRIKAACVGLANNNCCIGLYIFNAGQLTLCDHFDWKFSDLNFQLILNC